MGKAICFTSPLCATYSTFHPISIAPFPSPPPPFRLLSPPLPLYCFVCCSSSYEPEMLLWRFHKGFRFQPFSMRMEPGGGGGVWGYFKSSFLMPLSHAWTPPSPPPPLPHPSLLFFIQPFSFHSMLQLTLCCGEIWGQWMAGGRGLLINRTSILFAEILPSEKSKASVGT